jgi:hypothetical protein
MQAAIAASSFYTEPYPYTPFNPPAGGIVKVSCQSEGAERPQAACGLEGFLAEVTRPCGFPLSFGVHSAPVDQNTSGPLLPLLLLWL